MPTLKRKSPAKKRAAPRKWITLHSKSLPHYGRDGYVSFFDQFGIKQRVKEEDFKDITTPGGRFHQFYTYKIRTGRR